MDLYIYYQVPCARAEELMARVTAMQSSLSQQYGLAAGLKRRPEEKAGLHTWMETYNSVPDGFDAILMHAVTQAELASLIAGPRHTEYFLDISSCA